MTTQEIIYLVIAVGSAIFTIFNYFRKPQEESDKRQAVSEKEVDGKATLLAQQVQWEKEANAIRFTEMQAAIKDSTTMAQNHIHTIDTKVDTLTSLVNSMNLNITKEIATLSAIVEERAHRKQQ